MNDLPSGTNVVDGQQVGATDMIAALTAAPFVFQDGATQSFTADGRTTYVERGVPSDGEWSVAAEGTFASFWPPTYRATYTARWTVENEVPVGVSFTDTRSGVRYDGRYQSPAS
ncbi:hypothetical protein [Paractinoplanes globisporus]|uniref:Uncharacterized protein n=1 Tax=Paractinoplanes globisporus TaxID=113565 RepID=A0ABW6WGB2_9ACTN|nr:hypothetical protein [Actinoplanes globisporus]